MPKSSSKKSQKPVEELTYEEAFAELERIVNILEEGQRPLEESMSMYERGQALANQCGVLLEAARLKVQKLSGETLSPFEEGDE